MSNAFAHENTPYSSYGEFDPTGLDSMTDEDWAEYDAHVAAEMDKYDAMAEDGMIDFFPGEDVEPPF